MEWLTHLVVKRDTYELIQKYFHLIYLKSIRHFFSKTYIKYLGLWPSYYKVRKITSRLAALWGSGTQLSLVPQLSSSTAMESITSSRPQQLVVSESKQTSVLAKWVQFLKSVWWNGEWEGPKKEKIWKMQKQIKGVWEKKEGVQPKWRVKGLTGVTVRSRRIFNIRISVEMLLIYWVIQIEI